MVGEDYTVMLGMLQLNAALFFFARASCFEKIYWPFDVAYGAIYVLRVVYFFLWYAEDTATTRQNYAKWQKWSAFGLAAVVAANVVVSSIEWGHLPIFDLTSWGVTAGINVWHICAL